MTDNNLENRLDVNSEDDESFHGFPPEDSFQGSGRQAAQNVDSDAHVSNNSTDTNLAKLFQDMMVENRRRDALIERLVDKLTVQPAGPNTNVAVMPELLKNLTTFDGNSANAKQWIKSLTSAQLLHDLPDTYMLETARTRLVSGASYWYAVNEPEIQTWQQFVDRFNSTFVPKESFSTKWRKMVARTQHKGEGLSGYFHEKVKLCKELDLDIRELKEQVLIGLWSKQMCDAMFGIKHFSVDQLFHDLQEYSQLESERVSRIVEASHNRSITRGGTIPRRDADGANVQGPRDISRDASRQIPQRNERSATRTEQPTSSTYLPARNSEGKPLCFQCKKYGHTSKYCLQTRPNRSAMPREITRTAANPDTTQNNPGPSVNLNVIGEHADDSNFKYFQPAYVNGELVEAYVDFGSQCTLIKENTVKQLGLVLNPLDRSFKITGFGNGSVKPIAKTYAEIKIDQAKAYTELLVIPDEYQQVPLLIGQPFTEQNHIVVVKKDDQLRLFDNDLYKIELPALPKPAVNLFVKEKQVLPSNHVGFITVYTEDYSNENVFVDAQNYENKFIPRCIITLEHGEAAIPVYNLTAYDAKMDANIKSTKEEQQYHSYELETLCVIWAMERLRVYLIGQPFVVITDCSALRSTFSKKHMNPRVGRWWMKSLEFHFEIRHRPGRQMTHVDALSRNPVAPAQEIDCVKSINCLMNTLEEDDWLCILQKEDPKLRLMMENIEKQEKSSEDKREKYNEYEIKDGRLFKKEDGKLLWVVPRKARCQIARKYHNELGHPGFEKTYKKMREMFYFPRMRNYMKGFIGACIECLYNKVPGGKPQGKLHSIDKIGKPFHTMHLDHLGPFVKSQRGNSYILVAIDGFTKFTFLKAVKNTKSTVTVKALGDIVNLIGLPNRVITDRGTSFTGAPFENFCKERHIDHVLTTPSTARANGQVERLNRYITPSLASLCKKEDHSDWDQQVNTVQWGINNTHHQATKTTPFRLLFNYEPRDIHGDCIQKILLEHQQEEDIENRRQEALEKIKEDQERQKRRYNAKRSKASVYEPGDLVMIRREASSTGESRKLMEKYKGPYIVTEKLPFDRYRIEDMPETQRTQKFYKSVVAVDCMKRFMAPQSEDDSDEEPEKPVEEKGTEKKTIEKEEKRTKKRPQYLSDYVTTFGDES
nr:unnamed protein product [Callosobruchus analis]